MIVCVFVFYGGRYLLGMGRTREARSSLRDEEDGGRQNDQQGKIE